MIVLLQEKLIIHLACNAELLVKSAFYWICSPLKEVTTRGMKYENYLFSGQFRLDFKSNLRSNWLFESLFFSKVCFCCFCHEFFKNLWFDKLLACLFCLKVSKIELSYLFAFMFMIHYLPLNCHLTNLFLLTFPTYYLLFFSLFHLLCSPTFHILQILNKTTITFLFFLLLI